MHVCPELRTGIARAIIEPAMRAMIARHWQPKIVATIGLDGFVCLLRFVICASEIAIHEPGKNLIALDGYNRRHSNFHLAVFMIRSINDRFRSNLRLVDWRHWLRLARQTTLHPTELRRVHRRELDHRYAYIAFVMQ